MLAAGAVLVSRLQVPLLSTGTTMNALYFLLAIAFCSWVSCVAGSLLPSNASIVAPTFAAWALALSVYDWPKELFRPDAKIAIFGAPLTLIGDESPTSTE